MLYIFKANLIDLIRMVFELCVIAAGGAGVAAWWPRQLGAKFACQLIASAPVSSALELLDQFVNFRFFWPFSVFC